MARGRMGARRAWRRGSVEEEMRRRTEESRECWDFEYQRCMGCGPSGRADVCGECNCGGQGAEGGVGGVEERRG
jgi:hypothetical protein